MSTPNSMQFSNFQQYLNNHQLNQQTPCNKNIAQKYFKVNSQLTSQKPNISVQKHLQINNPGYSFQDLHFNLLNTNPKFNQSSTLIKKPKDNTSSIVQLLQQKKLDIKTKMVLPKENQHTHSMSQLPPILNTESTKHFQQWGVQEEAEKAKKALNKTDIQPTLPQKTQNTRSSTPNHNRRIVLKSTKNNHKKQEYIERNSFGPISFKPFQTEQSFCEWDTQDPPELPTVNNTNRAGQPTFQECQKRLEQIQKAKQQKLVEQKAKKLKKQLQ